MTSPALDQYLKPNSKFRPEAELLVELRQGLALHEAERAGVSADAAAWVRHIRATARPSLVERMFAAFPMGQPAGRALMGLAEAQLRAPDAATKGALMEDALRHTDWSISQGVRRDLMGSVARRLLQLGKLSQKLPLIRPLARPLARTAMTLGLRHMAAAFVAGETIAAAMPTPDAPREPHSFDMLGEAAMCAADADLYAARYAEALDGLAAQPGESLHARHGISIKLTALYPRFEALHEGEAIAALVPRVTALAQRAKALNVGLTLDAEEQDRLRLMALVFAAVAENPALADWDGFGMVIQAYGKRALPLIDWLEALGHHLGRRFTVRLVKGAYWDAEIKHAQVEGHADFPVFTTKAATDVSYLACAQRLIDGCPALYPQFATHNAHSLAAIAGFARAAGRAPDSFELQRLFGMGAPLHALAAQAMGRPSRVYAPVGPTADLLAYLVRRLMENGANAAFVNQLFDPAVRPEDLAQDPLHRLEETTRPTALRHPGALYSPARPNATGWDVSEPAAVAHLNAAIAAPLPEPKNLCVPAVSPTYHPRQSPHDGSDLPPLPEVSAGDVAATLAAAETWNAPARVRARTLNKAANLIEGESPRLIAALTREAGKTLGDGIAEIREAVDFLRYYAQAALTLRPAAQPRGPVVAISPWNFPLAIFLGQISGALAAGNAVIAKPAESTPQIATLAISLLHAAGVPRASLQLVHGRGACVGTALSQQRGVQALVFTGSTQTAQAINTAMAQHMRPGTPLIAETGGLNAMIVDATALCEQAVGDIVRSAFQSAGQRCSALRCLYIEEALAPRLLPMLRGAMDALYIGDPRALACDVGPLIDKTAQARVLSYLDAQAGRIRHQVPVPEGVPMAGCYVPPTLIEVAGIEDLAEEIFGPVLHYAVVPKGALAALPAHINARGYGLTFGLHSRLTGLAEGMSQSVRAGNIYINRDQIGAVVGSQPFGGQGLSGTGPKAGGPLYVARFARANAAPAQPATAMPGPTGERNAYTLTPRAPLLCLGPGQAARGEQVAAVEALGGVARQGLADSEDLSSLKNLGGVLFWEAGGPGPVSAQLAATLAARPGPIIPLITAQPDVGHVMHERLVCTNTAAAGGNAELLAIAG